MRKSLQHFDPDKIVTIAEAADIIGLAYSSLAQAVREGRVQAHKSRGTWLIAIAALQQAIDEGDIRPPDENQRQVQS